MVILCFKLCSTKLSHHQLNNLINYVRRNNYQTAPWCPSKVPSLSPLREYLEEIQIIIVEWITLYWIVRDVLSSFLPDIGMMILGWGEEEISFPKQQVGQSWKPDQAHLLYLICVIERSWPCIIRGLIFTLKQMLIIELGCNSAGLHIPHSACEYHMPPGDQGRIHRKGFNA